MDISKSSEYLSLLYRIENIDKQIDKLLEEKRRLEDILFRNFSENIIHGESNGDNYNS